jgi:hypothetical protein
MTIKVEDGAGRQFSCDDNVEFSYSSSRRLREMGYVKAYLSEDQKLSIEADEHELFVKATQLLAVLANDSTLYIGKLCIIKKEI